jgi:type I restriction enzyme S subunit
VEGGGVVSEGKEAARLPAGKAGAGGARRYKAYPAYKHSGVEWLGEIPAHWEVKRLKYVAPARISKLDVKPDDAVYVGLEHVEPWTGRLLLENQPETVDSVVGSFRAGDVLFGKLRPYLAKVARPDFDGVCTSEILPLRPVPGCSQSYVMYELLNAPYIHWLDSLTYGTKMPRVSPEQVASSFVGLPPLPEQRAIAAFLDRETARIDALVAKKERLIALLEEQRTALITRAVTKGLDPTVPMKDSGVEWLGEIPAHWEVRKLAWLTECLDGRRVPLNAEERGRMQGEYPYWGANSIVDYVDKWLFDEELVLLGEDGAPFFDRTKRVAFRVCGKVWVNNHAHVLRPGRLVDAAFLANALDCVDYRAFIDGTTRDKLTQGDMNAIPMQCPDLAEQRAIAAFLDRETSRIDALVAKVREAIERLKELRTALISAAVTGKIDVREEVALDGSQITQ